MVELTLNLEEIKTGKKKIKKEQLIYDLKKPYQENNLTFKEVFSLVRKELYLNKNYNKKNNQNIIILNEDIIENYIKKLESFIKSDDEEFIYNEIDESALNMSIKIINEKHKEISKFQNTIIDLIITGLKEVGICSISIQRFYKIVQDYMDSVAAKVKQEHNIDSNCFSNDILTIFKIYLEGRENKELFNFYPDDILDLEELEQKDRNKYDLITKYKNCIEAFKEEIIATKNDQINYENHEKHLEIVRQELSSYFH